MRRNYLKRSTKGLRRDSQKSHDFARQRRRLNALGKQGKVNRRANRILAATFKGSQFCEARLPGCWGNAALSWSHHSKRRKLSAEELTEAALMCVPCHEQWEHLSPEELKANVKGLIAKRETELPEAA